MVIYSRFQCVVQNFLGILSVIWYPDRFLAAKLKFVKNDIRDWSKLKIKK